MHSHSIVDVETVVILSHSFIVWFLFYLFYKEYLYFKLFIINGKVTLPIFVSTEKGINGEDMSCLTESALQSLATSTGPRMKLLKAIKRMHTDSCSSDSRSKDSMPTVDSNPISSQDDTSESSADLSYVEVPDPSR